MTALTTSLKELSKEQIMKAFEKTRAETKIPGIRLELITEEQSDKALDFARDVFMANEPINQSIGVEWNETVKEFWLAALSANLSLMFVAEDTDEIIAFRTVDIVSKDDKLDVSAFKSSSIMDFIEFSLYCDDKADFFGRYDITEAFHFLGLAVKEGYRGRGYATAIFNATIRMIRHFGFDQAYIKGEGSSAYAQRIYAKNGFDILYMQPFDTWTVEGRQPIQNTGDHKSMKVFGLKVTADNVK